MPAGTTKKIRIYEKKQVTPTRSVGGKKESKAFYFFTCLRNHPLFAKKACARKNAERAALFIIGLY